MLSGNLFKVRAFRRKGGKGKAPVGFEVERPWTKQVTAVLRDVSRASDATELEEWQQRKT